MAMANALEKELDDEGRIPVDTTTCTKLLLLLPPALSRIKRLFISSYSHL